VTIVVAIFGAAVSPYVFFRESVQARVDSEQARLEGEEALVELKRIRFATYVGTAVATAVGLAIIVTTAAALRASGVTNIQSSAHAAEALRPIAGPFAFTLFAIGIVGTGLLAIPVLAGSAAYAIGEARLWPVGLSRRPQEAKAFYATLVFATLIGIALNFGDIDPMQTLFLSAVTNGFVAVPMLAMMILIASRRSILGDFPSAPLCGPWAG
jgi:Mn2+/Fe2+ NRAMP family transporter